MRIMDYPKTAEVVKGQTFINIDSAVNGTKAIEVDDLRKQLMGFVSAEEYYDFLDGLGIPWQLRADIFRGKNLGDTYTDEQKARVADGTFRGMFIGDYWEKDGVKYRLADINYWLLTGDVACATGHLVIIPDNIISIAPMNLTDTTAGGYASSQLGGQLLSEISSVYDVADVVFGKSYLLNHRNIFCNAVSTGSPSGGSWYDSKIDLMSEVMVYGSFCYTPSNDGQRCPYRASVDKTQISLFRLCSGYIIAKDMEGRRTSYWLRDIISSANFSIVTSSGYQSHTNASSKLGIRPAFGIVG